MASAMTTRTILPFAALNAIGISIFLFAASYFWIESDLANVPGASAGDAFGWIVYAAPIPVIFVVIDLIWMIVGIAQRPRLARLQYLGAFLGAMAFWAAACIIDGNHHGM